ncbi:pentapeptide repeat-containing protein [Hyalangium gracile]|uniref:pentapeptide repeat-containing protein n=1 Tax=Hyalangium gracile TaxID=394092 RepID=UPI001CCE7EE7|nr:pentapeptide repeat-containing protein [Hyalangium gracile]
MHSRPELVSRWNTPDGLRRRARLLELGLRGPWRSVLAGFAATAELGDNLGDLRGIELSQQELPGADLLRARLDGANLEDADLAGARLELATLSGASLNWATLDRANLLACVALEARWDDASLEEAVLTASNLTGSSFRRARMRGAHLTVATLKRADLRVADLRGADVRYCDFEDACIACVRRDRPRLYRTELARLAERNGFPTFRDALELSPGGSALRFLHSRELFLHVEAALEASPELGGEIIALLETPELFSQLLGALALVLGGANARTLQALWSAMDRDRAPAQLALVALLVDQEFERKAASRLSGPPRPPRPQVRASLAWAHERLTGARVPRPDVTEEELRHADSVNRRWLKGLRRFVEPDLQLAWPALLV